MSAIYQRARPSTFAQVVGQEHVKDVLQAALAQDRTGHAYLFSGPRGVGKTTTARLLAMALNCEAEAGERPCGVCGSCRMVRQGAHPDVIELDAASNNSVDDVRDLREKISLASMRGGKRIWILDEAHMLSKAAANALLKTLEEPPPGLVFVLATTEPEKLPPTVLSRCQHYRFRRLSEAEITGKLERLCEDAGVPAQPDALGLVARAADGAMRDAESLLERLLTTGRTITREDAEEALGLPPVHRIQTLAGAVAEGDLKTLFLQAEELYRDGYAPRSLADSLGTVLKDALRGAVVEPEEAEFTLPLEETRLLRLIHTLDEEKERFIRRDDLYSLEVALLKCVNALATPAAAAAPGAGTDVPAAVAGAVPAAGVPVAGAPVRPAAVPADAPTKAPAGGRKQASAPTGAAGGAGAGAGGDGGDPLPPFDPTGRSPAPEQSKRKEASREAPASGPAPARLDWHAVRSAASPQLKAFLMPARERVDGDEVVVSYGDTHKFHYSQLLQRQDELLQLIEQVGGPGYTLRIEGPEGASTKKP